MSAPEVQRIAVFGAGVMGHGIAQVAAQAGFDVRVQDLQEEILEKAQNSIQKNLDEGVAKGKVTHAEKEESLKRIQFTKDFSQALDQVDLVIEAIPEKLPLKIEFFGKVSRKVSEKTILATNTSSLSIGKIASATVKPERVIGMHFFNPPHKVKLLELVHSPRTAKEVIEQARGVAEKMGREVIVIKDSPGFATSRLGVVLGLEAMRMVEEGVARPEDIDQALVAGYRHPVGPLRLSDLIGLDTRLDIADYLFKELGKDQYRAPRILREMVAEGKLGKKSGRGFYDWGENQ